MDLEDMVQLLFNYFWFLDILYKENDEKENEHDLQLQKVEKLDMIGNFLKNSY